MSRNNRHKDPESAAKAQADVLSLYEQGLTVGRIAQTVHMSGEMVCIYLERENIIAPRTKKGVTILRDQILYLHNQSWPAFKIAKELHKDHSTILYHMEKMGLHAVGKPPKKEPIKRIKEPVKDYKWYLKQAGIKKPSVVPWAW